MGPPDNDLDLVGDPVGNEAIESQSAGDPIDDGQHVGPEVFLQRRVLVEVVENNLCHCVTLEDNNKTLTGSTRGLVPDVCNSAELSLFDEVSNLDGQIVRIHLVRQLCDNEAGATLNLLDRDHGTHLDGATSRAVGILNPT